MADINAIKLPDGITYNITDKKLEINQADNNTFYYPILGADESAAIRQYDGGLRYMRDDDAGKSIFMIGQTQQMNDEVSSTGELVLTDYNEGMTTITTDGTSNNVTLYLPSEDGTLALTSDIPSVPSWAMASTKPTYTASEVGAQPILVSGTNIKTINGESVLGSGDISINFVAAQIVRW